MSLLTCINWVGTLTFAISGALMGIKKHCDMLGVIILGAVTAVGGGATRDIIVGHVPVALQDENLLWGVIIISLLSMYIPHWIQKVDRILIYADALGLALFSVLGAKVGCEVQLHFLGVTFLGALSGVGGGVIRDMLSNEVPAIMLPGEIYAVAAAGGAAVFYFLNLSFPALALIMGAAVTFFIRMVSIRYGLSLPTSRKI